MLRVSVELVPSGHRRARIIASADIVNTTGGAQPDYRVALHEEFANTVRDGVLRSYPRWSGSVWELVARSVLCALTHEEALPQRPAPLDIPVRDDGSVRYVRLDDIPEPACAAFASALYGSTVPVVAGEAGPCAYAWDFKDFVEGRRAPRGPLLADRRQNSEKATTEAEEGLARRLVGLQRALYDASAPLEFLGLFDYRIAPNDVGKTIGELLCARVQARAKEFEHAAARDRGAPTGS